MGKIVILQRNVSNEFSTFLHIHIFCASAFSLQHMNSMLAYESFMNSILLMWDVMLNCLICK